MAYLVRLIPTMFEDGKRPVKHDLLAIWQIQRLQRHFLDSVKEQRWPLKNLNARYPDSTDTSRAKPGSVAV
ncbi:hypothetical protein [Xanthomonas arboricola]|uniref:hypothetical protein n=1 Tax=Xanthomonas arboricola TaxID=56448 RepID=UPI0025B0BFE4|nr:hypothetical protein [Xanthomonas arboricola]MDN0209809.1 hypothetical protein [Xanthomonas arboricola pv. corylina]MDN0214124.1 hypothetical protein [Xanthomonas arboricola pv. corylina]